MQCAPGCVITISLPKYTSQRLPLQNVSRQHRIAHAMHSRTWTYIYWYYGVPWKEIHCPTFFSEVPLQTALKANANMFHLNKLRRHVQTYLDQFLLWVSHRDISEGLERDTGDSLAHIFTCSAHKRDNPTEINCFKIIFFSYGSRWYEPIRHSSTLKLLWTFCSSC